MIRRMPPIQTVDEDIVSVWEALYGKLWELRTSEPGSATILVKCKYKGKSIIFGEFYEMCEGREYDYNIGPDKIVRVKYKQVRDGILLFFHTPSLK